MSGDLGWVARGAVPDEQDRRRAHAMIPETAVRGDYLGNVWKIVIPRPERTAPRMTAAANATIRYFRSLRTES